MIKHIRTLKQFGIRQLKQLLDPRINWYHQWGGQGIVSAIQINRSLILMPMLHIHHKILALVLLTKGLKESSGIVRYSTRKISVLKLKFITPFLANYVLAKTTSSRRLRRYILIHFQSWTPTDHPPLSP